MTIQETRKRYYVAHRDYLIETGRLWRQKNIDRVNQKRLELKIIREKNAYKYSREFSKKNQIFAVKYLGGFCVECGFNDPVVSCYDFHHRDASLKKFQLSMNFFRFSFDQLIEELDKCDLLCARCHRKHHAKENVRGKYLHLDPCSYVDFPAKSAEHRALYNRFFAYNNRLMSFEYKGERCWCCGFSERFLECYDYHHRDGEKKLFMISQGMRLYCFSKISSELDKCDLLCANCHRKVHCSSARSVA